MSPALHPLDEITRLKRVHTRWMRLQAALGIFPVFAIINRFHPMLTDGYGGDLVPTLLPEVLERHYNLVLAIGLAALAASELLRRRFHSRHKEDIEL